MKRVPFLLTLLAVLCFSANGCRTAEESGYSASAQEIEQGKQETRETAAEAGKWSKCPHAEAMAKQAHAEASAKCTRAAAQEKAKCPNAGDKTKCCLVDAKAQCTRAENEETTCITVLPHIRGSCLRLATCSHPASSTCGCRLSRPSPTLSVPVPVTASNRVVSLPGAGSPAP